MKKSTVFTFILFTFFVTSLIGQSEHKTQYDYIASGYYQLVYEAEIAHLEGNDSLAFEKLQEAERRCPLINRFTYNEIDLYCRLLMKNRQFDKAISYMDTLANKYGKFSVNALVEVGKDENLSKSLLKEIPDFYLSIMPKLLKDSEIYYYSQERDSIVTILYDIGASDQKVRKEMKYDASDTERLRETDLFNYNRLFQLIDRFGFPNTKLYGCANVKMIERMDVVFMHIADHKDIEDKMLQFVRNGQCDPSLYGIVVDRKTMIKSVHKREKPKSIYGTATNGNDDEIIDIEHLDERRISIGMPTREMNNKRSELILQRYEQQVNNYLSRKK
ncbi:MAG: hypothetical protein LBF04_00130 [Prevotellaceae bacterium]|nr:hypothetical protein [Prevotellaceae bacterium]